MTRAAHLHTALKAAAMSGLALAAAGCAAYGAHDPKTPGWFKQRVKETSAQPFPQLASVPTATPAPGKSHNEWDAIAADTKAAGADLNASPRSAPVNMTPEETAAFEAKARQEAEGAPPPR